mmetsp:Transcript_3469/g.12328  ORF Transcript_3469/g.12328 Transcript_3469/m.12328 type:complete len:481 (-) Transcript_3469:56-1498(-)|eukprot:CAMPEP_0183824888 /NCGR_PEP_ID=MMETSP0807_2-20130328/795_1 /TAXON_ID=88271 /ORGANISM="Picocystis salinarum, Strain CCMP1897" /LENGTH=480 /DNA_ID=CAMNT_0026069841 /DNA_START=603 /DNA_END=2045 /DNA_ORIENTATION=-
MEFGASWCDETDQRDQIIDSLTTSLGSGEAANAFVQTVCDSWTGSNFTFILVSAYLVFFMQTGFAMLCAGSVRTKNTMNILIKNVLDACAGALAYYVTGWAFAYGASANGFIGHSNFALAGIDKTGSFDWSLYLFQWAFAAATATIVSGSVAERTQFGAYLGYSIFLTAFVYPVISHWGWSSEGWLSAFRGDYGGLLFNCGYIDFAGSGIVHMTGGLAGLAGAYFVGPRMGRYDEDGKPVEIRGHSASLVVLGTFVLWVGWYGFNPGSALAISNPGYANIASRTAVTTTLSAASGGMVTLVYLYFRHHIYDLIAVCNGILGGLVGITAGCSVVEPWAAIIIGGIAAMIIQGVDFVLNKLQIDDPLQAVHIHGFCGMWGVFVVGIMATEKYVNQVYGTDSRGNYYGLFYGGGGNLLACQLVGIFAIAGWTLGLLGPFFFFMNKFGFLRCSAEVEQIGLDVSKHGGSAYAYDMGVDPTSKAI